MSKMRVRFAPSPTGALHIGGVRTALYNYLLAKKEGGTFILRVEDTDQTRFVPGAEEYIVEALRWLGIAPTEGQHFGGDFGPYRQSERKALYQAYSDQLIAKGCAYYAFDTAEEIEIMREKYKAQGNTFQYAAATRQLMSNSISLSEELVKQKLDAGERHVVRLKIPDNQIVSVKDLIRGTIDFNTSELDDKVLMKADGMPTYHLANIVDDYLMKITHVIRGEEWLPSAAHHVLIYRAFGWEGTMPEFAHLPLILRPDGKGKLSKRDGAKFGFPVFPLAWKGTSEEDSFPGFRELGFEPEAVLNFLALLGWSSGTDQEIFSIEELVKLFSLERINKAGARFDYDKAKWFNHQYIMHENNMTLAQKIRPQIEAHGHYKDDEYIAQFCNLMKERVTFLSEFWENGYYCFEPVREYDVDAVKKRWKKDNKTKFNELCDTIEAHEDFDASALEARVKAFINDNTMKMGEVLPMLRIALSGTLQGPNVFEVSTLLGKKETVHRLKIAFEKFDALII